MSGCTNEIANSGLFEGLTSDVLGEYTANLNTRQLGKGEIWEIENSRERLLYVLCSGQIEINQDGEISKASQKGDFFGEFCLLKDEPLYARVTAQQDSQILEIPRNVFAILGFAHPVAVTNLIRIVSQRENFSKEDFGDAISLLISKNRLMAVEMTASKITHDIKSPLTIISLTSQLIESMHPDATELTASIIKQVKLVEDLVRETLEFVTGAPTELNIRKVDLNLFLRDLKETYGASLKSRNITLTLDNRCGEEVYFDEERIRRVIINLLRNSSEALKDDGEIKIVAGISSNWLQISVIDDGPGIPESIVPDLFKPFTTFGKPYGTGLGLAICNKIVLEHTGRLEYKPVSPKGSRFDIRLPQNRA